MTLVVQKICARHILANWYRSWKGIKRRKIVWRIVKSTFEAELKVKIHEMKKLRKTWLG